MLRKMITNILAAIGLLLICSQLPAQTEYPEFTLHSETPPVSDHTSPVSTIHRVIKESPFYEYLLNHPNFIKIQDVARQVWENQTGKKRRVNFSRKKSYSINID